MGVKYSSHAHKAGSWYLLGAFFKISDKHPHPFYMGVSQGMQTERERALKLTPVSYIFFV